MKNAHVNNPLLYVTQPEFAKPEVKMQSEFILSNEFSSNDQIKVKNSRGKSFNSLSIAGKIDYLMMFPKDLFQMKCVIVTEEKTYRGTILRRLDDMIEVRYAGRRVATIKISNIKQIELLGL